MSVIGQLNALCKHFQIHTKLIWDIQSMITYMSPEGLVLFSEIPQTVPLTSTVTETEMNHQHLNRHSQLISIGISLPFIQCPDI